MSKVKDFTFCVLSYNHSKYILTHLESIKYQVIAFGEGINCHLIITEDHSSDNTLLLIKNWLDRNQHIFISVNLVKNPVNQGTCYCTIKILESLKTNYFKLTAGDDYYSKNNIFQFVSNEPEFDILSGLPIRLNNERIYYSFFEIFNYLLSNYIYSRNTLLDRLSNVSIINAPNLFYSRHLVKKPEVYEILNSFDVVEDLPLQISIAENNKTSNLTSTLIPVVIYRRTPSSTYIAESKRFNNDQINAFNLLLDINSRQGNSFNVFIVKLRKKFFLQKKKSRKSLNLVYLIYFLRGLYYIPRVIWDYKRIKFDLKEEEVHYQNLINNQNVYD